MDFKDLKELFSLIYPEFYTQRNFDGCELVFLEGAAGHVKNLKVSDKTRCEALENHVHICDNVRRGDLAEIVNYGKKIAENLASVLAKAFPSKRFIVYFTVTTGDSAIVRFHQIWDNEPLYFDPDFKEPKSEIFTYYSQDSRQAY